MHFTLYLIIALLYLANGYIMGIKKLILGLLNSYRILNFYEIEIDL